jgi:hypothetical protein
VNTEKVQLGVIVRVLKKLVKKMVYTSGEALEIPHTPVSSVIFKPREHNVANEFNHLKLKTYVTHHQFNIQQLYALPTLYLCVLYLSENKQRLVPLTA